VQNTTGLKSLGKENLEILQSISETDWKQVVELMQKQG